MLSVAQQATLPSKLVDSHLATLDNTNGNEPQLVDVLRESALQLQAGGSLPGVE